MFDIQEELKKLPGKPGVYIMHDEKDAIIYVGKAVSLKNRVRQYFQVSRNKGAKIDQMVTQDPAFRVYRDRLGAGGPGPGVQPHQGASSEIQHHAEG